MRGWSHAHSAGFRVERVILFVSYSLRLRNDEFESEKQRFLRS